MKDFTSLLSQQEKVRLTVLAALREIYDGRWDRPMGIDGGKKISWDGKLGVLAACTDAIDSHHAVIAIMGQRFNLYRLPEADAEQQALMAIKQNGREPEMRAALKTAVTAFFRGRDYSDLMPTVSNRMALRLAHLAMLAVRCRTPVQRDSYNSRDILLVPAPEAPSRLVKGLNKLWSALLVLGIPQQRSWELVRKVAFDSIPKIRRLLFDQLVKAKDYQTTREIALAIRYPTKTVHRALEDLAVHRVVLRTTQEGKKGDVWACTPETMQLYADTPETLNSDDFD